MKNHIVFKFLAVLLCAASLLGAVGGALGVFALTEWDLYDKTVEQVREEQLADHARMFAEFTARRYASTTLGEMPMETVDQVIGFYSPFRSSYYGYRLVDAEGNELESREIPDGDAAQTYTYTVSGQYLHLVEKTTISQELEKQEPVVTVPATDEGIRYMDAPYDVLVDEIPTEGAVLSEIQISSPENSNGVSGGEVGTVFRNQDGVVILRSPGWYVGDLDPVVTAIALWDMEGRLIYEASAEDGVGVLSYAQDGSGDLVFTSFLPYTGPVAVAEMPTEIPTEATEMPTEATEVPTEAIGEPTEVTEEVTEATEETVEETVPEETKKKKKSEDAEDVTEAAEETESKKSKKKKATEETVVPTEAPVETMVVTVEPTVEAVVIVMPPVETAPAETEPAETEPMETEPEETEPVLINGKPLEEYQISRDSYYDGSLGEEVSVSYVYVPMPEMTVELYLAPGALGDEAAYTVLKLVRQVRGYLFPVLGICLLMMAVTAVYLCCAAGRKPGTNEIRATGLNRIPLDLYGFCGFGGIVGLCFLIVEGGEYLLRQNVMVGCAFAVAMAYLACLLVVGFCFACVAQFKTPGGFWWRNSLCGMAWRLGIWLCKWAWRVCVLFVKWCVNKGWPLLVRLVKGILNLIRALWMWFWGSLKRFYKWLYKGLSRVYDLLPITWQWLLTGGILVVLFLISIAAGSLFLLWTAILLGFALVLYGAHCFGSLMEATRKMNRGDLNSKADDKMMIGAFKDFAHDLNDLADVAVVAAQKQLKSERMKTELITNVSHDIKTPLTSIINYVDLLQKPHTEEEQAQYLEVLDRQSQRLKKLIDDLMDMSKASTGNMTVDITLVDAVESVNQALGEFSDKLERAQLIPVFRHTEPTVAMMADGRLVWRVLSNLLGNAVKYAMPGTRLYIDLMQLEGKVVISLKNISREELNVDAEELMERFVRGDGSRNTEGSGLGLNIAKSLMELQKGQLQLLVDGDLFKVTLIFPGL